MFTLPFLFAGAQQWELNLLARLLRGGLLVDMSAGPHLLAHPLTHLPGRLLDSDRLKALLFGDRRDALSYSVRPLRCLRFVPLVGWLLVFICRS